MKRHSVTVIGAGVAGLCCALELAERGARVEVVERGRALGEGSCSWQAGGMLAPWCERATTDAAVATMGAASIEWWSQHFPGIGPQRQPGRGPAARLDRSRALCRAHRPFRMDRRRCASPPSSPISPAASAGRCSFRDEAHLDPRVALAALVERLADRGVAIRFGVDAVARRRARRCRRRLPRLRCARRPFRPARRARRNGGGALPRRRRSHGRSACCIRGSRSTSCRAATVFS